MMRAWVVVAALGCGSPPPATPPRATPAERCGFADFAALDAAAWAAARGYNYKVERKLGPKWPDGGPPPLGRCLRRDTPPAVGSCLLHAIDPLITRYVLRAGDRDVAQISLEGTLLLVPGLAVAGFTVGTSSDVVLEQHPPDRFRISCLGTGLGTMCSFKIAGAEEMIPKLNFVVDGDLSGELDGLAAYEFFRHKPLRGVQLLTRM